MEFQKNDSVLLGKLSRVSLSFENLTSIEFTDKILDDTFAKYPFNYRFFLSYTKLANGDNSVFYIDKNQRLNARIFDDSGTLIKNYSDLLKGNKKLFYMMAVSMDRRLCVVSASRRRNAFDSVQRICKHISCFNEATHANSKCVLSQN
jgi:hypothetical protein